MPAQAIAVDLGGTKVRAGLVSEDGTLGFHASAETLSTAGPDAVVSQIATLVEEVRANAKDQVEVIGISAPGPLDTRRGVVCAVQSMVGLEGFPLRAELERRLGAPIVLENDGIAGAVGEWRFGAGRGATEMIYVTLSTGVGGGIIANDRPLRGSRGLAGHVGHIFFAANWQRHPGGAMSCFEDFISGTALAFRARNEVARHEGSLLANAMPIDAKAVIAAAANGDLLARGLVEDEARAIGTGLASLAHVLNPERIIVGGGLSTALPMLLPGVVAAMADNLKPGFETVEVVQAGLGVHSCLLGAAALALDPNLSDRIPGVPYESHAP